MKGGQALECREMPRAKSELWRIQVQHRGPEYPGGGEESGSGLGGGTDPFFFSFTLGWLVLRVQNLTTSNDSGGPMTMSKSRFFLVLEQGK